MAVRGVTGIVLAGGRSTRFGRDKLSVPYRGRPLLHHVVSTLGDLCEDVVVVLAPGRDPTDPVIGRGALAGLARHRLHVALDPEEGQGPLMGLLAGLEATTTEVALVVGGDMPRLVPAVLDDLLERLSIGRDDAVVLDDGDGIRPLPAALRAGPARSAARGLLDAGERSLRALLVSLDALSVDRGTWSMIDPEGLTLLDVDEPGDLGGR